MPIPTKSAINLALLELTADGEAHSTKEATAALAERLGLTDSERHELLPSGEPRFRTSVSWSRYGLIQAGLLRAPRRGAFEITPRGRQILAERPTDLPDSALKRIAAGSFPPAGEDGESPSPRDEDDQSPVERMASADALLRAELASELLDAVKQAPPEFFERLVVDLLQRMGYGWVEEAGRVIGKTGDGGIDGEIEEDPLGLDVVYLQAKRWSGPVPRPELQKFHGALAGRKARKGVFITTSSFTQAAREFAESVDFRIVLMDGEQLVRTMIAHDVGVATRHTWVLKELDKDYFPHD